MKRHAFLAFVVTLVMATSLRADKILHHVVAPGGQAVGPSQRLTLVLGQNCVGTVAGVAHRAEFGYLTASRAFHLDDQVAVAISSFEAAVEDRTVSLAWEIGHADELQGFNIYRSEVGTDDEFIRVNDDQLDAEKGMSYSDDSVLGGKTYWYRLGAVDRDGEFLSYIAEVATPAWQTELDQNFPNPFNPTTTIRYYIAEQGRVTLNIYNVRGQLVRRVVKDVLPVGPQEFVWNGTDDNSTPVATGMYFYRLTVGGKSYTKKMMLLK